jgi:hypothetical protein
VSLNLKSLFSPDDLQIFMLMEISQTEKYQDDKFSLISVIYGQKNVIGVDGSLAEKKKVSGGRNRRRE